MKIAIAKANPELLDEWDWAKNRNKADPYTLASCSSQKVWWRCKTCGYEWQASAYSRHVGGGCHKCATKRRAEKKRITALKNGQNTLANVDPELAKEWNSEKNKITPDQVTPNTTTKAWWTCSKCGYVYYSSIANRHKNKSGCPVCANQLLCSGINDINSLYPEIAIEWSDRNTVTPDQVLAGGHTKYYFRCCRCGHEWKAEVVSRINGKGCPNCSNSLHTSLPEQVLFRCLIDSFSDVENHYKPQWLGGREIDIYIPSLALGIEYDGSGWHHDTYKDKNKTETLKEHGIMLIRVREPNCPFIDDGSVQVITSKPSNNLIYLQEAIEKVYKIINQQYGVAIELIADVKAIYYEELAKYRDKVLDKSFAAVYSSLLLEWDSNKNRGLDPAKMPPHSNVMVWWKCKICGYEWKASLDQRAGGSGCPYCSHEVVWVGHNDLATMYPELLKEWDYKKNSFAPETVSPQSHKKVWWVCQKCGHEWESFLYSRTSGHNCPNCAKEKTVSTKMKRVKNIVTGIEYESATIASKETGILHSCITRVCRREGKRAGGYRWIYVTDNMEQ